MAHQDTQSATSINERERQSRGAPHGTNADLWAFLRQAAVVAGASALAGFLAVLFFAQLQGAL